MSLPPLKNAKNLVPDFMIRKSKEHLYKKDSLFVKMIPNKELPQYIKLSQDVRFLEDVQNKNLLILINIDYYIVNENGELLEDKKKHTMIPRILNENYIPYSLPALEHTKESVTKSSVPTLPPIGRTYGGSKLTEKTIQYRGKSHKVYMGAKGGNFIYTDASHKHKKYV